MSESDKLEPTAEGAADAIEGYQGAHSRLTLVIAASGKGKSTSLRNMDPSTTFLINVLGKELPFPKARHYIEGTNMETTRNAAQIREKLKSVSKDHPEFTDIVVDDLHYVMAGEFMDKAMQKGYDKFTMMARNIYDILVTANELRPGLNVFMLTHEEETTGGARRMKTLGKLLEEKITPEGLATIVLWGESVREDGGRNRYFFSTQTDGSTGAKSPMEMFPPEIDNDLAKVSERIREYYDDVSLAKSKVKF